MKNDRSNNVRLLNEIKTGRLPIVALRQDRIYVFMEEQPGQYRMDGRLFNQQQYDAFCRTIIDANSKTATILVNRKPDTIITFVIDEKCEPIP